MASRDPHFMRLGMYLAWVDRHDGWSFEDMEYLEEQFQEEPWMNWVRVEFPERLDGGNGAPFVRLAKGNAKGESSHLNHFTDNSDESRDQEQV